MCSHGSFVKDDMKIDDLSLGGLELSEHRLEKPIKKSLCQMSKHSPKIHRLQVFYLLNS